MDKAQLRQMIQEDRITEAFQHLQEEAKNPQTVKSLHLLKGRYQELNRKNSSGVIDRNTYVLERNQIRSALLDLVEGDAVATTTTAAKSGLSPNLIILIAVVVVAGILGIVFFGGGDSTSPQSEPLQSEVGDRENPKVRGDTIVPEKEETNPAPPPNEPIEPEPLPEEPAITAQDIKTALGNQQFQITLPTFQFSEVRTYKAGLAVLERQFNWRATVKAGVGSNRMNVQSGNSPATFQIVLNRAQLAHQVDIQRGPSKTVSNSLWQDESAKDAEFYSQVSINSLTKTKINQQLIADQELPSKIKANLESDVQSWLLRKFDGLSKNQLTVQLMQLELYQGQVVSF